MTTSHFLFQTVSTTFMEQFQPLRVMSLSEIMQPSLTLRSKESITDARKFADIQNGPVSTPIIIQGVGKIDVKTCYRPGLVGLLLLQLR